MFEDVELQMGVLLMLGFVQHVSHCLWCRPLLTVDTMGMGDKSVNQVNTPTLPEFDVFCFCSCAAV